MSNLEHLIENSLSERYEETVRLLKLAVYDFSNMYDHIFDCDGMCDTCPLHGERDHCLKWRCADEVEKLLKEESTND